MGIVEIDGKVAIVEPTGTVLVAPVATVSLNPAPAIGDTVWVVDPPAPQQATVLAVFGPRWPEFNLTRVDGQPIRKEPFQIVTP